ncbi:hypothetical protein [Undibacterium rugosum]|uniref:6-phosphogluconolactonase, cycloisomerase 2 family n=1 Tax=Undibacterium rugosum TaxID=2762291 RepID=A0A923KZW7_9BURK|nr:hypothetical protein [Undibacterium rugosum]MBC3935811.1 hypothetical protein [Undibacterium rugosum]MBR7780234.1 hypothetical protein [Undibacterium rugosum]
MTVAYAVNTQADFYSVDPVLASVNPANLTQLKSAKFKDHPNAIPQNVVLSHDGKFVILLASEQTGSRVIAFSVNADGTLAECPSSVTTAHMAMSIAVHPKRALVYVTECGTGSDQKTIYVYSCDTTGLTLSQTVQTTGVPENIAIAPNGRTAYVTEFVSTPQGLSAALVAYGNAKGTFGSQIGSYPLSTGNSGEIAIDSNGECLFVLTPNSAATGMTLLSFTISTDGTLTEVGNSGLTSTPPLSSLIAVHPTASYLYLLTPPSSGNEVVEITPFPYNSDTGIISDAGDGYTYGNQKTNPAAMAFSVAGDMLFVANSVGSEPNSTGNIKMILVEETSGSLSLGSKISALVPMNVCAS